MANNSEVGAAGAYAHNHVPLWRNRGGLLLSVVLMIADVLIFTDHEGHLLGALPFLFLLACPLMHMFMHHGHGRQDEANGEGSRT